MASRCRRFEVREIGDERRAIHYCDRSDARRTPERLWAGHPCHLLTKVRVVDQIERNLARLITAETRQPLVDVGGV